jgi:hypothetical protein
MFMRRHTLCAAELVTPGNMSEKSINQNKPSVLALGVGSLAYSVA